VSRRNRAIVWCAAVVAAASWTVGAVPAAQADPPLPHSMAAIGDSISRGFDVCCSFGEHPQNAWSTGDAAGDGVTSHYEHLLAADPAIAGNSFNDAVTGARMADAPGQAAQAVSHGVDYVTILMGANDVCTSSVASMTPTATLKAQLAQTLTTLTTGLPAAHIYVSSIPNVFHLWKILHTNSNAEFVWSFAQICQSLLSPSDTAADRKAVLKRTKQDNKAIAAVCLQFAACRFDGFEAFNFGFTPAQVSTIDYFHPSLAGQEALAANSWPLSWWPSIA
jgi:lysophospholipase L1-like esterase